MRRIHRPMVLRNLISANADPYFDKVVLLLHGDGEDNGTTFTDSSSYARSPDSVLTTVVTSQGNQQFGTAALNFTGGRIYYADSDDFNMASGDFTCELWFRLNESGGSGSRCNFNGQAASDGGNQTFGLGKNTSNKLIAEADNGSVVSLTGTTTLSINTWYHAALVRDGDVLRLFLNGAQEASAAFTGTIADRSDKLAVGGAGEYIGTYGGTYGVRMTGLIEEFRITKGVARYTEAFVPPTGPFPHY